MNLWHRLRPATLVTTLLAGLTTYLTLLAWSRFAEDPSGYLVPILGGVVLVAASGLVLRAGRLPAVVVLLLQVVVVLVWLHHRFAAPYAVAGWVPTGTSLQAMLDVIVESGSAAQSYSAPVPRSVPEFYPLMVVAGVLTAVLVDFLAVGLRRAPLAGLPLLAVYTAPVSILDGGVSWPKFAAAALAFLFLIAADESQRLAHWGHQLSGAGRVFDTQATPVSSQAVWSSARKIGLTATGLAVIVPIFVPTFSTSLFGDGNGSGDGDGDSVSISNPMVDLRRDLARGQDVDLVEVTTTEKDPSYLRISVLNSFDGSAWRPSGRSIPVKQRALGEVPRPPGLSPAVPTRQTPATLRVSGAFKSRWLPTPYPVASVQAAGDWRYDRTTMDFISAADGQTTEGLTYRVSALDIDPSAADLADAVPAPASVYSPNTRLPRELPAGVRRLAREVTEGRDSKFEQAVALQSWFRRDGGFTYSLDRSSGNGTDELVSFLGTGRGSRTGYCEQFAAAMATMGRSLGIPSRVAVGFLRPDRRGEDTYVYSSHDLHAWPEMYFGGIGWVRFEPTPQDRATSVPGYTRQDVPSAQPTESRSSASAVAPPLNRADRDNALTPGAGAGDRGSALLRPAFLATLGSVLLLVLLLLAPRTTRSWIRRRRWRDVGDSTGVAEAAWAELRDSALDLGITWRDRLTLRATATALIAGFASPAPSDAGGATGAAGRPEKRGPGSDPDAEAALRRLVGRTEQARYARSVPADAAAAEQVRTDVDRCVAALMAGAGRRRRLRATWLPASLLLSFRARPARSRGRGPVLAEAGVDRAV